MNGFNNLKDIEELKDYSPRLDPTVTPISDLAEEEFTTIANLPHPAVRTNQTGYYTSEDYVQLYKSGTITPLQVAESLLPLIKRDGKNSGPHSIAFIDSKEDIIYRAAKESTERYKQGKPLSPLDGVPVAIKDEVDLSGYKRTKGSRLDLTDPHDATAWCIQKWIDAGAVIIGKTSMHEVGLDTTNNNPIWGTPVNPHNNGYYSGGSSGGSAVAVAKGLCPIAFGVDGGGSIRLPASYCGLYGIKPTHGRISARGSVEMMDSVGVNGPMACSVDDLVLGYRILAQPDPQSQTSSTFPNSLLKNTPSVKPANGKKYLGLYQDWIKRSDPEVLKMFNQAIDYYVNKLGYEVVEISIPFLPECQKAHALTILSESRSWLSSHDVKQLTYSNQLLLNVAGANATAQEFLFAQRLRSLLMSHLAWLWEQYPGMLIMTPTTPGAGWKIAQPGDIESGYGVSDGNQSLKSMEYVYLANFVGTPAISCPMGYAAGNVPVGIMVCYKFHPFIC